MSAPPLVFVVRIVRHFGADVALCGTVRPPHRQPVGWDDLGPDDVFCAVCVRRRIAQVDSAVER